MKGFGREASNESDHTVGTAILEDYSRAEYYLASSSNTNFLRKRDLIWPTTRNHLRDAAQSEFPIASAVTCCMSGRVLWGGAILWLVTVGAQTGWTRSRSVGGHYNDQLCGSSWHRRACVTAHQRPSSKSDHASWCAHSNSD